MVEIQGKNPGNQRYYAVAHRLPRLPRELVHEVLNDISMQKVLEIICNHDLPYLDECITSHIQFGKLLPAEALPKVKGYFKLHIKLRNYNRRNPHPNVAALEPDAAFFIKSMKGSSTPPNFATLIRAVIIKDVTKLSPFFPVLSDFVDGPTPLVIPGIEFWNTTTAEGVREMVEIIESADRKLGLIKADQLTRMADLLERYPNLIHPCVEKSEVPTRLAHNVLYLRSESERIRQYPEQILRDRWAGRIIFAQQQFYLIPYDRVVRVFLKVLDRIPPEGVVIKDHKKPVLSDDDSDVELEKVRLKKPSKRPRHKYPPELQVVFDGIARLYPRHKGEHEEQTAPRIINTRYSIPGRKASGGACQPGVFVYQTHPSPRVMKHWEGIYPMAEKEFEWLEAFLSVCTYMSNMKEEWSMGRTVAEYWEAHVGRSSKSG